jgi:hypothetical protein
LLAPGASRIMPQMRAVSISIAVCALAGAAVGVWFGPSIGETALVGAVAIGLMGTVPGLIVGLAVASLRRRRRRRADAVAARERFVAVLNSTPSAEQRFSIDAGDPRALISDYTRDLDPAVSAAAIEHLRASLRERFGGDSPAYAEARAHGFDRWVFRLNGVTILERALR